MTPIRIEEAIVEETRKLRDLPDIIRDAAIGAAQAESAYKSKFAQERLKARAQGKITEAAAEDLATVATEVLRLDFLTSQAILGASRDALKVSITRIDALRTLSASVRVNT